MAGSRDEVPRAQSPDRTMERRIVRAVFRFPTRIRKPYASDYGMGVEFMVCEGVTTFRDGKTGLLPVPSVLDHLTSGFGVF